MIKKALLALPIILAAGIVGCGAKEDDITIIGGADGPTSVFVASKVGEEQTEDIQDERVSEEQILKAIKNYCYASNPALEEMEKTEVYPVYWEIVSRAENEITVLFRSYTGAQIRYYVDPSTGETYVTEYVPGITDEEQRTDESFNVRDYLSDYWYLYTGIWQTASMGYQDDDGLQPEFYVQFTESEINYGHMKEDAFVLDHSDKISQIEKDETDRFTVQAQSDNGVQYTYQTSEGDKSILEYYETWNEADFPEMYRGGASLSRSN